MRILRPTFCCLTLAACWSILVPEASAQFQSGGGQQSGSGRGGGSSSGGGSSMFSSGSSGGRSSTGGGMGATSAFGSGTGTGSGTRNGQGGMGGFGGNTGQGGAGSNQNGGFIGRNQDMSNFIGRTAQGQASGGGQGGNQGRGGGGGGNRSLDSGLLNMLNGGQGGGSGATQQPVIRPRLKAAFNFPSRPTGEVIAVSQGRFTEFAARYPKLDSVQMTVGTEGTVVLSGSVPSRDVAKLAESLMRLEPGVRKVENNLTYPQPAAE